MLIIFFSVSIAITVIRTGSSGDEWNWAIRKRIIIRLAIGVISENSNVNDFSLSQNYPNPFNPVTKISYELPVSEIIIIKVFDSNGKEILSLVNKKQSAVKYDVSFSGANLHSGVYYYEMNAGDFRQVKKMILLK